MTELDLQPLARSSVRRWECDENDHLNVRFHFALASDALEFLFRTRFDRPAPRAVHQHTRFIAEARLATPLLAQGALVAADQDTVTAYVEIVHGVDGTPMSAFTSTLDVAATDLNLDPADLGGLDALPPHGARRGLPSPMRRTDLPNLEAALSMNMVEIGRGIFPERECRGSHALPENIAGRIADGVVRLIGHVHGAQHLIDRTEGRVGGAVIEYELLYPRPIVPTTAYIARSGISALAGKLQHFSHWMFDAASGEMICGANAVAVTMDLEARRAIGFSPEQQAYIEARCDPALGL